MNKIINTICKWDEEHHELMMLAAAIIWLGALVGTVVGIMGLMSLK